MMLLSLTGLKRLLERIQQGQTEFETVECKEDLLLDKEGDRAFFLRHVAALANNVEQSHLILGVENKTWAVVGLPSGSDLLDVDATQLRINQALDNRLDPALSVRYSIYDIDGKTLGVVHVEGTSAPYVISVPDQQYGGERTRGRPCWIYRGAIYIRHGANSVICNRQSEILTIVTKAQPQSPVDLLKDFLQSYHYVDTESPDFGRHSPTDQLVQEYIPVGQSGDSRPPQATSWVTYAFCPVENGCRLNPVALQGKLKPEQRIGRGSEWYRGIPGSAFRRLLSDSSATPREFSGQFPELNNDGGPITHFIRVWPSGYIIIGCSDPLFWRKGETWSLRFVGLVGYLWQMMYLARAVCEDVGYLGRVAVVLNIVGTLGTRLANYARTPEQHRGWAEPGDFEYGPHRMMREVCRDPNIQIQRELELAEASDQQIEQAVREIARDVSLYYYQEEPTCFDINTGEFPARQYVDAYCR